MNRLKILTLLLLRRRMRRKRNVKKIWVHPNNERREEVGTFSALFEDLRKDDKKFFDFFRMSIRSFDELLGQLKHAIQRQNTKIRNCIQPVERLAITLRYLAIGCTFTELRNHFIIGISTARKIVRDTCQALWKVMRSECLPPLTREAWESMASGFERTANFPNCLGAVDGKHVRIVGPDHCKKMYRNHKRHHSIMLMAIADSKYRFVFVDVGKPGNDGNSSVFKETQLWRSIESHGSIKLPGDKCLPGTESPKVPHFLAADAAFGLHRHILRPYTGKQLTEEKRIFNFRLRRAKRYIDCAFGILSNKWGIFHQPIKVQPEFAIDIVKACIILHNYIMDRDGYVFEDTMSITGLEDIEGEDVTRGGLKANDVRSALCRYFVSDIGQLSWQYKI